MSLHLFLHLRQNLLQTLLNQLPMHQQLGLQLQSKIQLPQLLVVVTHNKREISPKLLQLVALEIISKEVLHCPVSKVWEIVIVNLVREVIHLWEEGVEVVVVVECLHRWHSKWWTVLYSRRWCKTQQLCNESLIAIHIWEEWQEIIHLKYKPN